MGFIFGAAVVLLIAALVLRSAHPQRALVVAALGGIGVLVAAGLWLLDRERSGPASIAPEQLTLAGVALSRDQYGAQLTGRLTNRSDARLGTVTLAVTFRECPAEGACRVLAEERPRIFLALPPGQTGGFSILLAQGALAGKPGVSWDCRIAAAQADF